MTSPKIIKQRLATLRSLMADHGIAAYIVPSTDAHQSEYVPTHWQRRPFISGFTGSAGDVVVEHGSAGLWTDGRYYLQASTELKGTGIKLFRAAEAETPSIQKHLGGTLRPGDVVGADPRLMSIKQWNQYADHLEDNEIELRAIDANLVDAVWQDATIDPPTPCRVQPSKLTGETVASKLRRIRKEMKEASADAHVLTTLDAIAWTFNLRGQDVSYNPVAIAYAIVQADSATVFIDPAKMPAAVCKKLGKGVNVRGYDDIASALEKFKGKRVWVDPASCNRWVAECLEDATLVERVSPVVPMKARKNAVEIAGMRTAHIRDGVAMVRFLHWLEDAVPAGGVTELSAAQHLESIRAEGDHFQGLSFATISGYAAHGAIIHYSVDEASNVPLSSRGVYLLDSGAQYLDGTTDITRTLLLGKRATKEQKDRFTRVLQGHIRLAKARFPKGVNGIRLDTLARSALWDAGLDYGHGTGHGVGAYLCVHEGPQSISVRGQVPIELGNILSNEPGYYEAGAYGIRIENLVVVVDSPTASGNAFFEFETITLCPIDTQLIDVALLSPAEKMWFNKYHRRVYSTLAPHLAPADKRWLKAATRAL